MRFWYWRRRPEVVRNDVDEELRVHLEMRIDLADTEAAALRVGREPHLARAREQGGEQ